MITMDDVRATHRLLASHYLLHKLCNANDGRAYSWYKPHEERQRLEMLLRAEGGLFQEVRFPDPVTLTITRILGHRERLYDPDSIGRGTAKQLIDAMVAVNWFVDDGPKHIEQVLYFQDDEQRTLSVGKAQPGILVRVWQRA